MAYHDTPRNDQGAGSDTEIDAFDLATDEALAQKDTSPAATGDEPDDPDGPSAAEGEPGSDAEARDDQPAGGAAEQPPAGQPTQDIWQNATEEQRAAFQAALAENQGLSTKVTRLIGQVSAADRQLARLRSQSGTTPGTQQGDSGQDSGNAADPFEAEDIKRWREEYGEIADPVLKLLKSQASEIAALKGPVAQVAQEREAQDRTAEIETFTRSHPDWEQYVSDARYPTWLAEQPKAVREAAERAVNVEDGAEAAWLLTQFKLSIGNGGQAPSPEQQRDSGRTSPSITELKRQRQLGAGRDGGGSAAPVQTGVPDDFDAAASAAEASLERRRQAQLR